MSNAYDPSEAYELYRSASVRLDKAMQELKQARNDLELTLRNLATMRTSLYPEELKAKYLHKLDNESAA